MAGRGGAGNIEAASWGKSLQQDLEAAHPESFTSDSIRETLQRQQSSRESAPIAHTGRGGAGNTFSPAALDARGEFSGMDPTSTTEKPRKGVMMSGRGGAGNYAPEVLEGKDGEEERIAIGARARREGEQGVQRPGRVWLTPGSGV